MFDDVRYAAKPYNTGFKIDDIELPINSDTDYEMGNPGHRMPRKGGYFPVPPMDSLQDMRSEMLSAMASMGVKVEKPLLDGGTGAGALFGDGDLVARGPAHPRTEDGPGKPERTPEPTAPRTRTRSRSRPAAHGANRVRTSPRPGPRVTTTTAIATSPPSLTSPRLRRRDETSLGSARDP